MNLADLLRAQPLRFALLALTAMFPAACTVIDSGNPFVGAWATPERQQVIFREQTILLTPTGGQPTPMSAATCDGTFRFAYSQRPREMLIGLTPRQPDLRRRLTGMLTQPQYQVAEVNCGDGYSAYVLVDDRSVVVIHRDREVGGLEQLTRL